MGQDGTKGRDAYVDNLKFVLMVFVVTGHALKIAFPSNNLPAVSVYSWIYSFHMPAFAFLSGLLTRSSVLDRRRIDGLIARILVPYAIFQVAYLVYDHVIFFSLGFDVLQTGPYMWMWYLLSLFFWRLLLPLWMRLSHPLLAAVCLGLLAGFVSSGTDIIGGGRTFTFFPFFVAGHLVEPVRLRRLATRRIRIVSGFVLLLTGIAWWSYIHHGGRWGFLFGLKPYDVNYLFGIDGPMYRLMWYLLAVSTGAAWFALTPQKRSVLTGIGERSLYIYLLHGFAVQGAKALHAPEWMYVTLGFLQQVLVIVVCSVVLTFLLGMPWIRRLLRPVLEPRPERVLRYGWLGFVLLLGLSQVDSLRFFGARRVSERRLQDERDEGVRVPDAGVILNIGDRAGAPYLELGVSGARQWDVLFASGHAFLGRATGRSPLDGDPSEPKAKIYVEVPAPAQEWKYSAVLIRPSAPCEDCRIFRAVPRRRGPAKNEPAKKKQKKRKKNGNASHDDRSAGTPARAPQRRAIDVQERE